MDISKINIDQLQATIANVEQLVDELVKLIPGPAGDQIRNVVSLVELIAANPVVLQLVMFLLSKIPAGASAEDIKNIVHSIDVSNIVA